MYSFDGQYKFGLSQSLGGASKKVNKSTLIESAKLERQERERHRKQNLAALKLQSYIRGYLLRSAQRKHYVYEFDEIKKTYNNDVDHLNHLTRILCLYFRIPNDYQRLVFLSQVLLKIVSSKKLNELFAVNQSLWIYRIKKLLLLSCRSLQLADVNISIPLRMLEVFTSPKSYAWLNEHQSIEISTSITSYLVYNGYFHDLRGLIIKRVPSSLEPSSHPPTAFAAAAKDLIMKPVKNTNINSLESDIFKHFIQDILLPPMPEQICYFLIPAISNDLPIIPLIHAIKDMNTSSPWLLYSFFMATESKIESLSTEEIVLLVKSLKILVKSLENRKESIQGAVGVSSSTSYDSDSDVSDDEMEITDTLKQIPSQNSCLIYTKEKCLEILNNKSIINSIISVLNKKKSSMEDHFVCDLCSICHHLMAVLHLPTHKSRFLYMLAFNQSFLRQCWYKLSNLKSTTNTGKQVYILNQLAHGHVISSYTQYDVMALLGVFSSLFRYALFSVYDTDFYAESAGSPTSAMPFTLKEMTEMSYILRDVVIGLIQVMHPDIKALQANQNQWLYTCQMVTQLVKHLYGRDSRHHFCPENHWLSAKAAISQESINISSFFEENEPSDVFKPGMSTLNLRGLAILKYVPFAVPFIQRVRIFQRILLVDKKNSQSEASVALPSHGLNISVNRKYLYQDAYDQLSKERAPDIKRVVRVHLINAQGLDEAGVDGGGVFREFMSQLMRTGFDPSYGFFKSSSQQLLYPNPEVGLIQPDYLKHFHFLGRMLGKIIYESMMVELPLADFFLCKLLNRFNSDVDIYHLESLDPELYKNLFTLKNYEDDIEDLSLNFTVVNNDYGETKIEELKPGGKDISVTANNKIEYIHLMADYRLNKQIRSHCNAFRAGLSDVINIEWLQMFDHKELQILISGAQVPIDIDDLKLNTSYSGSFTPDEPYMEKFWEILTSLTDQQKRQFLKFVTSCSRPPLLGFSELYPKFCIHYGGDEDRLPSASTCMNFLKLPRYETPELLKARLIYAIEAEAGFELS